MNNCTFSHVSYHPMKNTLALTLAAVLALGVSVTTLLHGRIQQRPKALLPRAQGVLQEARHRDVWRCRAEGGGSRGNHPTRRPRARGTRTTAILGRWRRLIVPRCRRRWNWNCPTCTRRDWTSGAAAPALLRLGS